MSKSETLVFGAQAAEHLQSFIADCDRRTELAKKRLAETQDEISAEVAAKVTVAPFLLQMRLGTAVLRGGAGVRCTRCAHLSSLLRHHKAERVHELNEEIGKMLAKAEQLGGEGNVEEAQKVLENVEKSRALKKEAEVKRYL